MSQQIQNPPGTGRRARRRNRGGGNRMLDESPQLFTMPVTTETAANTYTENKVSTPVAVVANGQMLCMEILRIWLQAPCPDVIAGAGVITQMTAHISRKSKTGIASLQDVDALAFCNIQNHNLAAAMGVVGGAPAGCVVYDYTDGKGNGLLYAGKEIFIGVKGTNNTSVKTVAGKLLYRLKQVNIAEYVGLLSE